MNKKKRILGVAGLSIFMCATLVVPNLAASLASEEHMEGANVVIDEYCEEVAAGTVAAQDSSVLTATEAAVQAEEQAEEQPQDIEDEEEDVHVELNLNYSRLGIASKVDTYLNVRKKPSESSSIVGKLTKNAGCHIYKIKKGWAKIVSGQVKGWVKASYLVTDEKAEELATKVGKNVALIETNSLRVRALPTTDAPIYSVVSEGEEFTIKKQNLTLDFVKKVIAKEKISKSALKKAGGYEKIEESLSDFVCIYVDDEYAFVAK